MGPEREKFIKAPTPEEKAQTAKEWVVKSLQNTKTVNDITKEIRNIVTSNAFRDLDADTRNKCYSVIRGAAIDYAHGLKQDLRGHIPEITDLERDVHREVDHILKQ